MHKDGAVHLTKHFVSLHVFKLHQHTKCKVQLALLQQEPAHSHILDFTDVNSPDTAHR
jgi:hypothetical protein